MKSLNLFKESISIKKTPGAKNSRDVKLQKRKTSTEFGESLREASALLRVTNLGGSVVSDGKQGSVLKLCVYAVLH